MTTLGRTMATVTRATSSMTSWRARCTASFCRYVFLSVTSVVSSVFSVRVVSWLCSFVVVVVWLAATVVVVRTRASRTLAVRRLENRCCHLAFGRCRCGGGFCLAVKRPSLDGSGARLSAQVLIGCVESSEVFCRKLIVVARL